jgi:chromosome segregation ATPase
VSCTHIYGGWEQSLTKNNSCAQTGHVAGDADAVIAEHERSRQRVETAENGVSSSLSYQIIATGWFSRFPIPAPGTRNLVQELTRRWALPQHTAVTPASIETTTSQRDNVNRIQYLEKEVAQLQDSVAEHISQNENATRWYAEELGKERRKDEQEKIALQRQLVANEVELVKEKRKNEHDRNTFDAQIRTLRQRVKQAEKENTTTSAAVDGFRITDKRLDDENQKLRAANEELRKQNVKIQKTASDASRLRRQRDRYRQDLSSVHNEQEVQQLRTQVAQQQTIIDGQAADMRECILELREIRSALRLENNTYPEDVVEEIERLRRKQRSRKRRRTRQLGGFAGLIDRLFS